MKRVFMLQLNQGDRTHHFTHLIASVLNVGYVLVLTGFNCGTLYNYEMLVMVRYSVYMIDLSLCENCFQTTGQSDL